ncbi:MAG: dephospho-CoA kinase, partial [Coriobacteriales bacterium]|nr:dephospho-CoA kinase [Coriobacteriales bacterium]
MYVVFVTGGLASGKKTVCELLHSWGATYLDADAIAKEEQEHPAILSLLAETFGKDIIYFDDVDKPCVNRCLLASRAFASKDEANKLNAIMWPAVQERLADYLVGGSCQLLSGTDFVVVEIALLYESSMNDATNI